MNTTVYSTGPSCFKCRTTVKMMERKHIPHDYVDLNDPGAALPAEIQSLIDTGAWTRMAPFVVTTDDAGDIVHEHTWNDVRPDRINDLAALAVVA